MFVYRSLATRCFYPHAPGGARPSFQVASSIILTVSIRTPRAGRDTTRALDLIYRPVFLSARPGRGATRANSLFSNWMYGFLSARPGRGATVQYCLANLPVVFLSARPGRGATAKSALFQRDVSVSIRTPRAGRDALRLNDAR